MDTATLETKAPAAETVAMRMARWVDNLKYEDLPPEVIDMAKRCLLDYLGVLIRGSTFPQVQPVFDYVSEIGGRPDSTVAMRGLKTTPAYAVYANATFAHSCEFDDAHELAGHPGVIAIPVAIAVAEANHMSGKEAILGIVAGYEMMVQAGACIHQIPLHIGWHNTKVMGVFGAAAVVAKMLRMTPEQTTNAFAISGSEAGGVMEYDQSGGEVKRLHAGSAARLGLQSAMVARAGLTGPNTIFEGKRGIWQMFAQGEFDRDPESYWNGAFYILRTMFKMSPAVGTVHGSIDSAREIIKMAKFEPEDIERIDAYVSKLAFTHGASIVHPEDCIGAQFSLAFSLGLVFVKGKASLMDYLDPACWSDPKIMAVADKVHPHIRETQKGASVLGGAVTVTLKDGRTFSYDQLLPRGNWKNPASTAELEEKFRDLVGDLMPKAQVDEIVDKVSKLDTIPDMAEFAKLMVPR